MHGAISKGSAGKGSFHAVGKGAYVVGKGADVHTEVGKGADVHIVVVGKGADDGTVVGKGAYYGKDGSKSGSKGTKGYYGGKGGYYGTKGTKGYYSGGSSASMFSSVSYESASQPWTDQEDQKGQESVKQLLTDNSLLGAGPISSAPTHQNYFVFGLSLVTAVGVTILSLV
jgi:hypothetical protein